MLISTYTGDKDILIQTVSLRKNYEKPSLTYGFYCMFCGESLCKIQGEVVKITPGLEPTEQPVVITKCMKCKKEFNFQNVSANSNSAKIRLTNYTKDVTTLHCFICRTPLLQYQKEHVVSLPEFSARNIPFSLRCIRPTCPANFSIVDIVQI